MRRFLFWLSGLLPCRIISDGERPYLERYFLCQAFGISAYLHRFVASDPDRGLHDHPWRWAVSFLLAGHYTEERRDGMRTVRWFNWLLGDSFHRVVMPHGAPSVWTLFVHRTENVKAWGFWHEESGCIEWSNGRAMARPPVVTWQPYLYKATDRTGRWWLDAPKGSKESRRMPPTAG